MILENTPTVETERLILRKFETADREDMFEILSDEKTNTFLPWFTVKNAEEAERFIKERYISFYERESAYRYAICLKESMKVVGYIGISDDDSHDLGYGINRKFWGQGIASEAARAVAERVKNAGWEYITATHDVNNPMSGRVMEKTGMKYMYSYKELWQPKNIEVVFRMYQLNFDGTDRVYGKYRDMYGVFKENL